MTEGVAAGRAPAGGLATGYGWAACLAGLLAALAIVVAWSIGSGRYPVPLAHVAGILLARVSDVAVTWSPTEAVVVEVVRLPRVLTAAVAGLGLALSGAVLQGLFRNPLVGPQTIGTASGAALGGVTAILFFGSAFSVQLGTFLGAAAALAGVLAIHRTDNASPILMLVLAGVVVSAFCGALVGLVTYVADPETKLPGIVFWLLGSFAAATWSKLALITGCTGLAAAVMLAMRWRINVLSLGDEDARTLGVDPVRDRLLLLAATCLAVSAQVAVSGTIGWIGLVVPNLARLLVGADHRRLLPVSALLGPIVLVIADTLARDLTSAEIPVGIVTAIIGTPVFAYILHRTAASRGR